MWMQLSTFQTEPVIKKAKNTTEFTTIIAISSSVKENAKIKCVFSASLFPKQVVKVISGLEIVIHLYFM